MFNVRQFLEDYKIDYIEHGSNWQPGWVMINCPCCPDGDPSQHGGFCLSSGHYHCWRCGGHHVTKIINALVGTNNSESWKLVNKYGGWVDNEQNVESTVVNATTIELPTGTGELLAMHRKYLIDRNFDPDKLIKEWGIKGTNHRGSYKFRVMIPVYLNGRLVSYQGRDITDKQRLRYKACKLEKEVVCHKHTLYGIDKIFNRKCVVVEGVTDVWRLGVGAVGTFGTEFKLQQVLMLAKNVDKAYLMFDQGAEEKLQKLDMMLQSQGVETEQISFEGFDDPGEMDDDTAQEIMKELIG